MIPLIKMADWFGKITGSTLLAGILFPAYMTTQSLLNPPEVLSKREYTTQNEHVEDSLRRKCGKTYRQIDVLAKGRELLRIIDENNDGSVDDAYYPGNLFSHRKEIDKEKIADAYLSEPHNID